MIALWHFIVKVLRLELTTPLGGVCTFFGLLAVWFAVSQSGIELFVYIFDSFLRIAYIVSESTAESPLPQMMSTTAISISVLIYGLINVSIVLIGESIASENKGRKK